MAVFIFTLYILQEDPTRMAQAKHIKSQLMKTGHNLNEVSPDGKVRSSDIIIEKLARNSNDDSFL